MRTKSEPMLRSDASNIQGNLPSCIDKWYNQARMYDMQVWTHKNCLNSVECSNRENFGNIKATTLYLLA